MHYNRHPQQFTYGPEVLRRYLMKRVCTHCERISTDGNVWCQTPTCPSGTLTVVFDYGESLGDLEVVRLLRVLRMSAIYEAKRGNEQVLLKVAHDNCQEQIKL